MIETLDWTPGTPDPVGVRSAPDGETRTATLRRPAGAGNARTTTPRAFAGAEVGAILAKLG
jgi:uncharacterized protein with GYD domain